MKVWPIDPLVPRNLRLEVPEKLPQGLASATVPGSGVGNRALVRRLLHNAWGRGCSVTQPSAR